MPSTYTPIATTTGTGSSKVITFSSIPAGYTDLRLVANSICTSSVLAGAIIQFNSDTSSNYSVTYLSGNGSSAASSRASNQTSMEVGTVSSADWTTTLVDIQNYANATTYKTCLARHANTGYATYAYVGLWRKTPEAINSITFTHTGGSTAYFSTSSTFTLYGIAAA